jgi:hypothetical protein
MSMTIFVMVNKMANKSRAEIIAENRVRELIGNGIYLSKCNYRIEFGFPEGMVGKPEILQKVTCEYALKDVWTIDKKGGNSPLHDKTKIRSPRAFYDFLNRVAFRCYNWNHWGFVSRPIKLEVNRESIALEISDIADPERDEGAGCRIQSFDASFTVDGVCQYGGLLDDLMDWDKYHKLRKWAAEKLPPEHTIHKPL